MKHQEVTDLSPRCHSPGERDAARMRPCEKFSHMDVIPQNNEDRQPGGKERRDREGRKSSNREVICSRLKTRHLGSYSASPAAWMLLHPIGCCLPELHSNEPGRWEAASTHESSLLNPSSASPQPSLTSIAAAPALCTIDRSSLTRGQSGRGSQRKQDLS